MKSNLLVFMAISLAFGCTSGTEKSTGPVQPVKFTVGEPQTVISSEQFQELDLGFDAGLYALNDGGQWKWFAESRLWHTLYSIGPKDNPLDSIVVKKGPVKNVPDAHSFISPTNEGDHTWGNCLWIGNVYHNPENGHIIGFMHVEYNAKENKDGPHSNRNPDYFYFALTISKDGGKTFEWCGYFLSPNLSYETWLNHWLLPRNQAGGNMGLCNYITKDGYFYMYYADTEDSPDSLVRGTAVARARIEDVLQAADNYQVAPWHKYYNEEWNEPGMGGKFTALNLPPIHSIHGDAAYNSYLDKYVLVTLGTEERDNQFSGSVLISYSDDGMIWSDWQVVHRDSHWHVYPSIISEGNDNEVIGKSFWVYYQYVEEPANRGGKKRWDRVLVTLD